MAEGLNQQMLRASTLFMDGRYKEAFVLFEQGMQAGNTRAIFNYAYCLQYGYGIEADPARAFEVYGFLRYEEDGDAAYNAGAMLLTGRGVPCDPERGYEMMLRAAEHGCIEAQLYIAMVRLTGCVGEPDTVSIRRIPYHKPDDSDSAFLLPPTADEDGTYADELMDKRFEIVEADEYEAIRYIRMAARHDGDYTGVAVGNAEFLLAKCAEEGVGRMYDYGKAVELYVRAAEHGSIDAHRRLKALPPPDVEAARKRLRGHSAKPRLRLGSSNHRRAYDAYDEDDD